jgi:single-stranded DNA-binding protein
LADAATETFKKGQAVLVVGKCKIVKYEDKNGVERTTVEIAADEIAAVVKANKAPATKDLTEDPWL